MALASGGTRGPMILPAAPARLMRRLSRFGAVAMFAAAAAGCGARDDAIAAEVRTRLAASPRLRGASVSVIVKKGVVLLRGKVVATSQPSEARAVADDIPGVHTVLVDLTVTDEGIRSGVDEVLRADQLLSGVPIEVTVKGGVVRLASRATSADQRARAVTLARAVPGVTHVEDDMK